MSDKETSGPAFPLHPAISEKVGVHGMSLRAYAAIKLRVPDSGLPWLDEMITASLRDEFAKTAVQGILANGPGNFTDGQGKNCGDEVMLTAPYAYGIADAMMEARKK